MKKNTLQLTVVIALICCTLTLLGVGIWLGVSGVKDTPKTPTYSEENDNYTSNY